MLVLVFALIAPFVLCVGGAYLFHYPVTLGILFGFNLALMYIVLWVVINQIIKVHTQKMHITGENFVLSRKQLNINFPVYREFDLEVPLDKIRYISLMPTRIGYLLNTRFDQGDRLMGVDLDINPLSMENCMTLRELVTRLPGIEVDDKTKQVLAEFENKVLSWKGTFALSLFVIGLALVIFLFVSIYMGAKQY